MCNAEVEFWTYNTKGIILSHTNCGSHFGSNIISGSYRNCGNHSIYDNHSNFGSTANMVVTESLAFIASYEATETLVVSRFWVYKFLNGGWMTHKSRFKEGIRVELRRVIQVMWKKGCMSLPEYIIIISFHWLVYYMLMVYAYASIFVNLVEKSKSSHFFMKQKFW